MNLPHFFIDRPIFAAVLSILIVLVGALAYTQLPVSLFPDVVPPTVVVRATYPGATAQVVADTVATPIEQEINGVEDMLYLNSISTNDGQATITVTFKLGTDLDIAQVLTQNRVAIAESRLPEEARRLGITTQKQSPDLLMVAFLYSEDGVYDQLYVSNYATLQMRDELARVDGVGNVQLNGAREYSMRVWLDPERIQALGLTGPEVVEALRTQNVQVAAGQLAQPPVPGGHDFQIVVNTQGRFVDPEQFGNVIVKVGLPTGTQAAARVRPPTHRPLGMPDISMPRRAKGSKMMKGRPITGEEFDRMIAKVKTSRLHDESGDRKRPTPPSRNRMAADKARPPAKQPGRSPTQPCFMVSPARSSPRSSQTPRPTRSRYS
jgi:HAE1 family hydrophobic/amphiphilic exporter-1